MFQTEGIDENDIGQDEWDFWIFIWYDHKVVFFKWSHDVRVACEVLGNGMMNKEGLNGEKRKKILGEDIGKCKGFWERKRIDFMFGKIDKNFGGKNCVLRTGNFSPV